MKIIQLKNFSPTQMMGFLIIADDGSLIVIDGGNRADTEGFLNALEEYRGTRFATVDCWFMTHPHDDHYGVFAELTDRASRGIKITRGISATARRTTPWESMRSTSRARS